MLLAIRRTQNNLKVTKQFTDYLEGTQFPHSDVIKNEISLMAPWLFNNYVNSELSEFAKNDTPTIIFNQHLQSITSDLRDHTEIYTDGSKTDSGVGAAVVFKDHVSMLRLPDFCSIYSAEATAISHALDLIKTKRIRKAAILSDSLSSLRSIENPFTPNEIARKIQNQLYNLTNFGYSIILIWIPSHSQITGNERADENARQAISSPDAKKINGFTLHDAKSLSKTITSNIWLRAWRLGSTKLNEIKHTTLAWPFPPNIPRKIETAINRMRIGHSSLTHQHLMKREDPPICTSCGTQLTIKHIITECRQFESEKRKAGVPLILAEALQPANIQNTISFIINSNLINLL